MRFSVLLSLSAILAAHLAVAQSFVELGVTSFNNGDLKQAERWFEWAIRADSTDITPLMNRAQVRRARGNHQGSYDDFKRITQLDSANADASFQLAISAFHLGKYQEAIDYNTRAIEGRSSFGSQALLNRAQTHLRLEQGKLALQDFDAVIKLNDERLMQAHFERGQFYVRTNDLKSAIEDFKKVVEIAPNNIQLTWDIGRISYELEDYTNALSYYSKAIDKIDRPQVQMLLVRGETFEKLKSYEGAIQDYTRLIEMNPNLADAYYLRGQAKARLGNKENACVDWKKAAELGHTEAKGVIVYNCK
jgi:tetratricopeptide (TPR) repeat protein